MPQEARTQKMYLNINSKGFLYLSSKEPQEGYEEVKYGENNQNTTYHKLFDSTLHGKINSLWLGEKNLNGAKVRYLGIGIQPPANEVTGEEQPEEVLTFNLLVNKNLNDYIKSIICVLPNLDYDKEYSLSPSKKLNDRGFVYRTIYFNDRNGNLPILAHKFGDDIPNIEKKEGLGGKKEYDSEKQDKYLFKILEREIKRFNGQKDCQPSSGEPMGTNVETTVEKPKKAPKDANPEEEEYDDLPF